MYLPLSHGLGRDIAITLPLICGLVPHFGEDVEDLGTTLFEVAPTVLFTVPRYLQKFASRILVAIMESSPLKRRVHEAAMAIGRRYAHRRWSGRHARAGCGALCALPRAALPPGAQQAGIRPVAARGLRRHAAAAGDRGTVADLGREPVRGVRADRGSGCADQRPARAIPCPGDVGTIAPGWELRIAEIGELQIRGDYVFEEYLGQPEATRDVRGADGWLRTGDIGEWQDGLLRLLDRARDFIVTAGMARHFRLVHREHPAREPLHRRGGGVRPREKVPDCADRDRLRHRVRLGTQPQHSVQRLHQPRVPCRGRTLLKSELERANAQLARVEQIKAFRILPKALDPEEEGEPITPTRKVKRQQMYERFRELVESMYDRSEEEPLAREAGTVLQR